MTQYNAIMHTLRPPKETQLPQGKTSEQKSVLVMAFEFEAFSSGNSCK